MNGKSSMRMGGHNNRKPYRMKRFPDYKKAYVKLGPGRADAPTRSKVTRPPCLHPHLKTWTQNTLMEEAHERLHFASLKTK